MHITHHVLEGKENSSTDKVLFYNSVIIGNNFHEYFDYIERQVDECGIIVVKSFKSLDCATAIFLTLFILQKIAVYNTCNFFLQNPRDSSCLPSITTLKTLEL